MKKWIIALGVLVILIIGSILIKPTITGKVVYHEIKPKIMEQYHVCTESQECKENTFCDKKNINEESPTCTN